MKTLILVLLLALPVFCLPLAWSEETSVPAKEPPPPETFTNFEDSVAHVKEHGKFLLIACMMGGDKASRELGEVLDTNRIYLNSDAIAVYQYKVEDPGKLANFKSFFKVSGAGLPILIVADSGGKPLKSMTGPADLKKYITFVQDAAGEDAVEIPPQGMFDLTIGGGLVGADDLTEMRAWTLVTGRRITAALVEAKGSKGIFRTSENESMEIGFNLLSKPDVVYLKKHVPSLEELFPGSGF